MGHDKGLSMAGNGGTGRASSGIERVRAHLLSALHVGRLRPGDRVLSVRRLAMMTGLNRKTVHRAYRHLVEEGLLEVRPGSGTFVAEAKTPIGGRQASTGDLVSAVNRCRTEASALGLSPDVFAGFIGNHLGGEMRGLPMAVAECNREQIDVMVRHLTGALGLSCRPVTLAELDASPARALDGMWGVVTTDCHKTEVAERVAELGRPVFRVALDREFPKRILEHAKKGLGLMVVSDAAFAPVFRRLLETLNAPPELVERVHLVCVEEASDRLLDRDDYRWIWISPEAAARPRLFVPRDVARVRAQWRIASSALDRLRARLALDLALRTRRV